jgi:hypothetical protein
MARLPRVIPPGELVASSADDVAGFSLHTSSNEKEAHRGPSQAEAHHPAAVSRTQGRRRQVLADRTPPDGLEASRSGFRPGEEVSESRERPTSLYDAVLSAKNPVADEPVDPGHRARLDPRLRPPARQRQLEQDRAAHAARQAVLTADKSTMKGQ